MSTAVLLGRCGPRRLAWLAGRLPCVSSGGAVHERPVSGSRVRFSNSAREGGGGGDEKVPLTIVNRDGLSLNTWGRVGDSLLDVVVDRELDIDGFGACEGTLACSTCHLIFPDEEVYSSLPPPSDEELDMLDLAYGLTNTSRLGCQVCVSASMHGLRVNVPAEASDIRQKFDSN